MLMNAFPSLDGEKPGGGELGYRPDACNHRGWR